MDMPLPQEKPPEGLSYAEREDILWDAAWRYMRGEISAQELQEIEDRYTWHIRRPIIHAPGVANYSDKQEKKSA